MSNFITRISVNKQSDKNINPLKNLKILNKFKKLFLSLNEDRALPRMIQNVVWAHSKGFFMLFLKHWYQFVWKSSGKEL